LRSSGSRERKKQGGLGKDIEKGNSKTAKKKGNGPKTGYPPSEKRVIGFFSISTEGRRVLGRGISGKGNPVGLKSGGRYLALKEGPSFSVHRGRNTPARQEPLRTKRKDHHGKLPGRGDCGRHLLFREKRLT